MDLALSARGIYFVAKAIAEGWGISASEICREFKPFLNGKYVRDKDGYTSAVYCSDGKENCVVKIDATTTALLVIDFIGTINGKHLQTFADGTKNKFLEITAEDIEEIQNALKSGRKQKT